MRVVFLNPQGNFDPEDRYWTEHPDFGGQLVYVKELAQALANEGVDVDIITRRVRDSQWIGFEKRIDYYPEIENLRIVRIPFGGDEFLRKEELWPYLTEFVEEILDFYARDNTGIDFATTHYADGGLAGVLLNQRAGIPFSFTGHSLGAQKMDKLGFAEENAVELENRYNFTKRISAERLSMERSAVNIVSTLQEWIQQYAHQLYQDAVQLKDDTRFVVIPPGVNSRIFYPVQDISKLTEIIQKIGWAKERYLTSDRWELPWIVASSRLDPKKNHLGLFTAFAENPELQRRSNLCVILRGIEDPFRAYGKLSGIEGRVLSELMGIVQRSKLQGKVCFLDLCSQREIADCYRYLSTKGGIFVLTALYEPFGLAPLEAAASGLPVVVTQNGGPGESFREDDREFGVLIDPESETSIAQGLLRLLRDSDEWKQITRAGIQRVTTCYTWEQTARKYLQVITEKVHSPNRQPNQFDYRSLTLSELMELYMNGGDSNDTD